MKNRLNEFIQLTESIDFNAQLIKKGDNYFVFENSEYENKPKEWKVCFRAGKETIETARVYAGKWLKEIESDK